MANEDYQQPAFPTYEHDNNIDGTPYLRLASEGMLLLDHLAAIALPQMIIKFWPHKENAAHHAYEYAREMMEARKKYIEQ